jgi:hypothetical protein
MQSARQPNIDHRMAVRSPRASATNRALVWFNDDAAQRRRRSVPADEETPSCPAAVASGATDHDHPSYAEIRRCAEARRAAHVQRLFRRIAARLTALSKRLPARVTAAVASSRPSVWLRPELLGCVALTSLAAAVIAWPGLYAATRPCRAEPMVLTPGTDLAVTMTVSHRAACSVSTRAENVTIDGLDVAVAPQHGDLALRGRTGVTYRPAREFTGDDFFAFALHRRSDAGDANSLVRVHVIVR